MMGRCLPSKSIQPQPRHRLNARVLLGDLSDKEPPPLTRIAKTVACKDQTNSLSAASANTVKCRKLLVAISRRLSLW